MPAERMSIRRAREILRLKLEGGLAVCDVVRRAGAPCTTVRALLERFPERGLTWRLGSLASEDELEALLCRGSGPRAGIADLQPGRTA